MGIKHFFMWFKSQFSSDMHRMSRGQTLQDVDIEIDNLMIDMNGVFHNSAQKIYEYGNHKLPPRLVRKVRPQRKRGLAVQIKVFEDVCKTVEALFAISKPKKRLILCVDGPAPISKQNQQRQRRFRSALEASPDAPFDSNSITPGTKFMDYLSKYIDWYIRKRVTEDETWQNIEVILSNEKAPGEGEHKIINFIRYYGKVDETYCINGLDADLIMLALGTHMPHFYILREDLYDPSNDYFCIDVGRVHGRLANLIRWDCPDHEFDANSAINDFIFLCFMVGNDFLPHIPSIEIIQSGIELILKVYQEVASGYGHMTQTASGRVRFVPKALAVFLKTIGFHEKDNLEKKLRKKRSYFEDKLLDSCSTQKKGGGWEVNIEKYKTDYWTASFPPDTNEKELCHNYLEGMQWVLSYYTRGVPNWKWHFAFHYAPPASVLAEHISTFQFPNYGRTIPSTPFQQLLSVLPPQSSKLLPTVLGDLLTRESSPLKEHCPTEIKIDLSGKRKEWEGIVLLPMVDFQLVRKCYFEQLSRVDPKDLRRNMAGRSFSYAHSNDHVHTFTSYYGDIHNCSVYVTKFDL